MTFWKKKTSNIGKLYVIGKHFFIASMNSESSPQNKVLFGSDQLTKFLFLHKNVCQRSRHVDLEWRVSFWRGGWDELVDTQFSRQNWPKTAVPWVCHRYCTGQYPCHRRAWATEEPWPEVLTTYESPSLAYKGETIEGNGYQLLVMRVVKREKERRGRWKE